MVEGFILGVTLCICCFQNQPGFIKKNEVLCAIYNPPIIKKMFRNGALQNDLEFPF